MPLAARIQLGNHILEFEVYYLKRQRKSLLWWLNPSITYLIYIIYGVSEIIAFEPADELGATANCAYVTPTKDRTRKKQSCHHGFLRVSSSNSSHVRSGDFEARKSSGKYQRKGDLAETMGPSGIETRRNPKKHTKHSKRQQETARERVPTWKHRTIFREIKKSSHVGVETPSP